MVLLTSQLQLFPLLHEFGTELCNLFFMRDPILLNDKLQSFLLHETSKNLLAPLAEDCAFVVRSLVEINDLLKCRYLIF